MSPYLSICLAKKFYDIETRRTFHYRHFREKINPKSWMYHKHVAVANAFYTPSQNFMEFPAGILQGVFFHLNAPMYLNFGAIGTIIGHELTHGFDDQGKQRNENGKNAVLELKQILLKRTFELTELKQCFYIPKSPLKIQYLMVFSICIGI